MTENAKILLQAEENERELSYIPPPPRTCLFDDPTEVELPRFVTER
jgi:hypothetical protein